MINSVALNQVDTKDSQNDVANAQPSRNKARTCLVAVAIALVVFSVGARLYRLDSKMFWFDEELIALRLSSQPARPQALFGKVMPASEWRKLEYITPSAPAQEVLHNLIEKFPPDQAPLYCMLAREWAQAFGFSPGPLRLLSVLGSFVAFPLAFALAIEMFGSVEIAWLTVALLACSPFDQYFAQEARQYSIWLCTILWSWTLLAKAQKVDGRKNWLMYGVSNGVAILTHYASFILTATSALSAMLPLSFAKIRSYLWVVMATVLVIAPWFIAAGLGCFHSHKEPWLSTPVAADTYINTCLQNCRNIFFDTSCFHLPFDQWINIAVTAIVIASAVLAYLRASKQGRVILQAGAFYALVFVSLDMLMGGIRFTVIRYMTPLVVLIQLCVACCLWNVFLKSAKLGSVLMALVLSLGVTSCVIMANHDMWTLKDYRGHNSRVVAKNLNAMQTPLWIGSQLPEALLLSRLVKGDVLIEIARPGTITIPAGTNRFLVCEDGVAIVKQICASGEWRARRLGYSADLYQFRKKSCDLRDGK